MTEHRNPKYKPVDNDWVYETVKHKIDLSDLQEETLKNAVDEVQFTITNYINRGYVPEPLKYVFVNLVMDLYNANKMSATDSPFGDFNIGNIASIRDGDTDIKLSSKNSMTTKHLANVDDFLFNYKLQLDKYRLIKW